jgi:starch-binding outer membrane protein, SusD/RagB family
MDKFLKRGNICSDFKSVFNHKIKNNMKNILRVYILLTLSIFSSCDGILEVKPRQNLPTESAITNKIGVDAATIGLYNYLQNLRWYGRDYMAVGEALADNGRATNKSGRLNNEFQNQLQAHFNNWLLPYDAINSANLILGALPAVTDMTPAQKTSVEGQCHFIRALSYFDLVRTYAYIPNVTVPQQDRGGVPIVLTGVSDPTKITFPARSPVKDVYDLIYSDLNQAIIKLAGEPANRAPAFATRAAAMTLFSRVALYNSDYANAVKFATDALALNVGRLSTTGDYVSDWRKGVHPESIFELVYIIQENLGVNESLQTTYTTLRVLGDRTLTAGFGDLVPTNPLLTAFGITRSGTVVTRGADVRAQLYELGTDGRGTAAIECTKFLGKNGQPNLDNIPVFRISELFLNRAEAQFRLGNRTEALTNLNVIRVRAGLTAATDAEFAGDLLLEEILNQRRLEFAFEGQRFFDIKRLGRDIIKAPANVPFQDIRILPNIPLREIQNNPNLVQNFGY